MTRLGVLLLPIVAISLLLGGNAVAQNVGDNSIYFTTYFSNANTTGAPDGTVRIVHDGDLGPFVNLWASIYVFDDSQELVECCSCVVTPDGLLSESVNKNLTAAPLTGRKPKVGVIKVISGKNESDKYTNFAPIVTSPGLREWATHIQKATGTGYAVTETLAANSNLVAGEQELLRELCYFDSLLSGYPCTCTQEDYDF
jgi:hypothetical protein